MKKLLILLSFISLTCLGAEPKFHFRDCVKVTHGFYRGCKGTVDGFVIEDINGNGVYSVQIDDCKGAGVYGEFNDTQLELSKGCK